MKRRNDAAYLCFGLVWPMFKLSVCSSVRLAVIFGLLVALLVLGSDDALAQKHRLDEMSLQRWSKLREVERHQLKIAERYFRESNWKVAADEYDKYLSLYENSDAASYALFRWSLTQVKLRKQNTAIDDGFRSVIDYWPDSEDAIASGYYIGKTYQEIGQLSKAKPALKDVAENHAKHIAGVYCLVALGEIAETESDQEQLVAIWRSLTFDAVRNKQSQRFCSQAAERLASHEFREGEFDEAVRALETVYKDDQLTTQVVNRGRSVIDKLIANSETQGKANGLAEKLVGYLRGLPADDSDAGREGAKAVVLMIADVYRAAKNDAKVKKTYGEVERRFGVDDQFLDHVATWHRGAKRYDEARREYRKFADKAAGLSKVAKTFREERNLQSAVATYDSLMSADANNAAKWNAEKAVTYREFEKYDLAIKVYEELMTQDVENSAKWLWAIASCYRDARKYKEAIGYFRQTDNFPSNYQEMARCHRRLKETGEAIALYNQVAGGSKAHAPWAMLQIGYTHEEAKSKANAIAAFKKVCKLFPKDRHASIAHAHLQNKYKISVTLGGAKD